MKPFAKHLVATVGVVGLVLAAASAHAVSPRAYVSVNGNDANTCNVPTTPCRTYARAISHATAGGEVIVMDSGTFGGGTISQSVKIHAPAGVVALAATPIIVDPGTGNAVVLRGLTFQAAVLGSGTGITHQSGTLFVENTVVDGWAVGLVSSSAAEGLFVKGSIFRNHHHGIGLWVQSGTKSVAIDDSFFERNYVGMDLEGGNGYVSNTVLAGNLHRGALLVGVDAEFTFHRCIASGGNVGLNASGGSILRVSQSTITRAGYGIVNQGSTVESFGNNVIRGNTTNTYGTITTVTLQ
jgi:hypothetical protein